MDKKTLIIFIVSVSILMIAAAILHPISNGQNNEEIDNTPKEEWIAPETGEVVTFKIHNLGNPNVVTPSENAATDKIVTPSGYKLYFSEKELIDYVNTSVWHHLYKDSEKIPDVFIDDIRPMRHQFDIKFMMTMHDKHEDKILPFIVLNETTGTISVQEFNADDFIDANETIMKNESISSDEMYENIYEYSLNIVTLDLPDDVKPGDVVWIIYPRYTTIEQQPGLTYYYLLLDEDEQGEYWTDVLGIISAEDLEDEELPTE